MTAAELLIVSSVSGVAQVEDHGLKLRKELLIQRSTNVVLFHGATLSEDPASEGERTWPSSHAHVS